MKFDEKLFLELCAKYDVEVIDGPGKNILVENGIEKEITEPLLKEILTGKSSFEEEREGFCNFIAEKFNSEILNIKGTDDYEENYLIAC